MKVRLVGAAVLLLSLSFAAAAQERIRLTRYVYDYKYTFTVFDEDLHKTPSWNPMTEEVPVSPRQAVAVAKVSIGDSSRATMKNGFLIASREPTDQRKWVYEIEFRNDELFASQGGPDYAFSIFVKMDGTVVEADVVPNDGKARVY
jgi:hypothetical protein